MSSIETVFERKTLSPIGLWATIIQDEHLVCFLHTAAIEAPSSNNIDLEVESNSTRPSNLSIPGSKRRRSTIFLVPLLLEPLWNLTQSTLNAWHMDSSLHEVWQAAAATPFLPAVGKGSQFIVAFVLLLLGLIATGVFALNRSFANVIVIGVPASLAIAFGTVYMFCAVGVYV